MIGSVFLVKVGILIINICNSALIFLLMICFCVLFIYLFINTPSWMI